MYYHVDIVQEDPSPLLVPGPAETLQSPLPGLVGDFTFKSRTTMLVQCRSAASLAAARANTSASESSRFVKFQDLNSNKKGQPIWPPR